jgi:hypothetical protein
MAPPPGFTLSFILGQLPTQKPVPAKLAKQYFARSSEHEYRYCVPLV